MDRELGSQQVVVADGIHRGRIATIVNPEPSQGLLLVEFEDGTAAWVAVDDVPRQVAAETPPRELGS